VFGILNNLKEILSSPFSEFISRQKQDGGKVAEIISRHLVFGGKMAENGS